MLSKLVIENLEAQVKALKQDRDEWRECANQLGRNLAEIAEQRDQAERELRRLRQAIATDKGPN